jgi:hypothetical protein
MTCDREKEILVAARRGALSDGLREHAASCRVCAEAASVSSWMNEFAASTRRERKLPDPSVVWLKAQLLRGPVNAARASRPLTAFQGIAYFVVAAGWAGLLTWRWDALEAFLRRLTPVGLVRGAAEAQGLSMSFFSLVLVLASITVMLALHTILAEE